MTGIDCSTPRGRKVLCTYHVAALCPAQKWFGRNFPSNLNGQFATEFLLNSLVADTRPFFKEHMGSLEDRASEVPAGLSVRYIFQQN